MPFFSPPVVYDNPPVNYDRQGRQGYSLFRHFGPRARGRTVVKVAGTYSTVDYPSQTLLDSATEVYLGGHVFEVSDTVSAALVAAGYTTWATPEAAGTVHGEPRIPHNVDDVYVVPNDPGPLPDPDLLAYFDVYTDVYSEAS